MHFLLHSGIPDVCSYSPRLLFDEQICFVMNFDSVLVYIAVH